MMYRISNNDKVVNVLVNPIYNWELVAKILLRKTPCVYYKPSQIIFDFICLCIVPNSIYINSQQNIHHILRYLLSS